MNSLDYRLTEEYRREQIRIADQERLAKEALEAQRRKPQGPQHRDHNSSGN
ncbi:MAG: hypothetical protein MUF87_09035 [Anaerolineae bacterium]|nr:hypothetical protein [Anaerolineae bacterium]